MTSEFDKMKIRDSQEAFNNALNNEKLVHNENESNFVGLYMYMYSDDKYDYFKHIETREYIKVLNNAPIS